MRLGILTHNFPTSYSDRRDAGVFVLDLVRELSKYCKVFVLAPKFTSRQKNMGLSITRFNWSGGREKLGNWSIFNPLSIFKFISLIISGNAATIEFVKKNKLDVLVSLWLVPAGIWAHHAKRQLGIHYITYSLGSDINKYAHYPLLSWFIKTALEGATVRLANSCDLTTKTVNLAKVDCQFLPVMTRSPQKARRIKLSNSCNFLFVGRLEKVKGIDILLSACQILAKKNINFHLYALGTGSLRPIQNLNEVTFVGQGSAQKVAAYMKSADFLVIPSRSESLPLVFVEAARAGLPVIATNVGD